MRRSLGLALLCLLVGIAGPVALSHAAGTSASSKNNTVLFGDQTIQSQGDSEPYGQAEAFPFTAGTAGTASSITVYVGNATALHAALYSDSDGTPGSLLVSGSTNASGAGWATASIAATPVAAGTRYWIALLGNSNLTYRDGTSSGSHRGCVSINTPTTEQVTNFPSSFPRGATYGACPLSAYVSSGAASSTAVPPTAAFGFSPASPQAGQSVAFDGTASTCAATPCSYAWQDNGSTGGPSPLGSGRTMNYTFQSAGTKYVQLTVTDSQGRTASMEHNVVVTAAPSPTSPPASTAVPVVSGTAQQGQALSTTNGSWNNSPTSYGYQWQDCDGSGASCTNIAGATGSSYTLTSNDVTHTIRSVVTATNAGGSTSASSAPTAVVSSSAGSSGGSSGGSSDCFASPGSCGYPDPSAGNVGATSSCSSLPASGSITANTAGQTIENLNVTGTITVNAANVTISNVCVTDSGGSQTGSVAILLYHGATGATVKNATVTGGDGPGGGGKSSVDQAVANDSSSVATVDSLYASDCGECIWNGPFNVSNSYVTTNGMQGTGDHLEDLYYSDSTINLTHDVLLDPENQNAPISGDTNWGGGGPCDNHLTLKNSLVAGGGFIADTCMNASGAGSMTADIENNRFARCITAPIVRNSATGGSNCQGATGQGPEDQPPSGSGADQYGYWPYGGYYGFWNTPGATGDGNCPGTTWVNNVWDNDGATALCTDYYTTTPNP